MYLNDGSAPGQKLTVYLAPPNKERLSKENTLKMQKQPCTPDGEGTRNNSVNVNINEIMF